MATKNPLDEIKKHEEAIAALRGEAVNELKNRLKELRGEIAAVEADIEKLTGKSAPSGGSGTRVRITIDQVAAEIAKGNTNNKSIADALGCSPATVKAAVAKDGKAAGVSSEGAQRGFKYLLKKK